MEMSQRLTNSRFPYLPIRLHVRQQASEMEALIDTGFDGGMAVPPDVFAGQPPDWYQRWALADGSQVLAPAYLGTVQVGDFDPVQTLIIALGDEPLVGLDMVTRFSVILDHGQRVIVEP